MPSAFELRTSMQGATFVYEAVLAPVVKILRREIAKNPTLDNTLNGPLAQGSVSTIPYLIDLSPH